MPLMPNSRKFVQENLDLVFTGLISSNGLLQLRELSGGLQCMYHEVEVGRLVVVGLVAGPSKRSSFSYVSYIKAQVKANLIP